MLRRLAASKSNAFQTISVLLSVILFILIPYSIQGLKAAKIIQTHAQTTNCQALAYPCREGLISFPQDEGKHSDKQVEWWYANFNDPTSNLSGAVALVRVNPGSGDQGALLLEITNKAQGTFYYRTLQGNITSTSGNQNVVFTPSTNPDITNVKFYQINEAFQYRLEVTGPDININLMLDSQKRPLVEGGDGYVPIFASDTSIESGYYSLTRLVTNGVLDLPSAPSININNSKGWIDHQWFNTPTGVNLTNFDPSQIRPHHEWFSLQLNNGVDIVAWQIFKEVGGILELSLKNMDVIDANGNQIHIENFDMDPRSYWTANDGRKFASIWRLKSGNLVDVTFQTAIANQYVSDWHTWEGASIITGGNYNGQSTLGVGFSEMTLNYPLAPCGNNVDFCDGFDNDCDYRVDEICTPNSTPTPTTIPISCAVSVLRFKTLNVGSSTALPAIVSNNTSPVHHISFTSSNGRITSVFPLTDYIQPYTTTLTGITSGSATVTTKVFLNARPTIAACQATTTVNVTKLLLTPAPNPTITF